MEATVKITHNRKYEVLLVLIFFLTWGFVFLDRLSVSFLMPVLTESLGINNTQVGILGFVTTGAYAISAIFFGALSDRSGVRKRWLVWFVLMTGAATGLCCIAQNYGHLLILRTIVGIGEGPLWALMMSILLRASSENSFGRNIGIVNAGVGAIAVTLGPIMVTQLVAHFSWQLTFLLTSIPTFIMLFIILKLVKEIKVESGADFRRSGELNQINKGRFGTLLSNKNVVLCTIIGICGFAAYWTLMLYAPLYLTNIAGLTVQQMGFITSFMGVLYIVFAFLVPKLSDNMGRKPAMTLFFALAIMAPLFMFIFPGTSPAIAAYVLFGSLPGALVPVYAVAIPLETVVDNLRTTAQGFVNGVGEFIGGSCMPIVVGRVADLSGLQTTMSLGAAFLTACFGVSLFVKETNQTVIAKRKAKKEAKNEAA
jgi:predicted MFS family arabinose efflux permease